MATTTATELITRRPPWGWLLFALIVWILAYWNLTPFANAVIALLGLARQTHLGEAVHFFVYDTPKVLLLLTGIVFVMGMGRHLEDWVRALQAESSAAHVEERLSWAERIDSAVGTPTRRASSRLWRPLLGKGPHWEPCWRL